MNKHPCSECDFFKVAKSGKTFNCKHPKITENDAYQYGRGNAIKYLSRAGKKTPDPKQDYEKAQWYLNKLVEVTE